MALPADDQRPQGRDRELISLLAPSPGRLEFATRQAVICALTVLIVEIYQTPDAALTVYIVFFLNRPDRATSLVMNVVMLLLMTFVIGLAMFATVFVIDQPVWRVATIATLSFGMLFLASASRLRPVGSIVGMIVGYALDLLGTLHAGEVATRALLWAWMFAAIPAGLSMVVNLLAAPPPRRLAEHALASRLRECAAMLRSSDPETRKTFEAGAEDGLGEIPAWLKLAGAEKSSPAGDIAALHHASESTIAIQLLVELATPKSGPLLPAAVRTQLAQLFDEMAAILGSGGYPVDVTVDLAGDDLELPPVSAALLADLRDAMIRFADAPSPPPQPAAKKPGGFFLADAFSNPEHVQYAVKTTAAAMFCYGLYNLLDWPSIHTCFLTCYIVALSTTAETIEKLTLRIFGCLLGAAIGIAAIVFIVPSLTSIGALMAVVFAGGLAAAWVAGGGPRIAYAGFQISFAFFLCVIQGPAPAFDMVTARDRVIGILIGNLVSYVVFVHVWPASVGRRIDPALAAMLRGLSAMASVHNLSGRRGMAAGALSAHSVVLRDLELIAYEPHWLRPSRDWVRSRSRALDDIAALTGPLLLAGDRGPPSAGFAARLSHLASMFSPVPAATSEPILPAKDLAPEGIWGLVDGRLTKLERSVAQSVGTEGTADNAPV